MTLTAIYIYIVIVIQGSQPPLFGFLVSLIKEWTQMKKENKNPQSRTRCKSQQHLEKNEEREEAMLFRLARRPDTVRQAAIRQGEGL